MSQLILVVIGRRRDSRLPSSAVVQLRLRPSPSTLVVADLVTRRCRRAGRQRRST